MLRQRIVRSVVISAASASAAIAQQEIATLRGLTADEHFGWSVAFVGDVDADGHEDFAVGAPHAGNSIQGNVRVFSGRTMAVLHNWYGAAADDRFGYSVAGAGDVDADGHGDIVAGAPTGVVFASWPGLNGSVQVRSGNTGAIVHSIPAPAAARAFGAAVAGGNDVDGDGVADVLVGAPGCPACDGAAYVFRGSDGSLLRTHLPTTSETTFGFAVAFAGDVNGDGVSEYAVGAPGAFSLTMSFVQFFDGASGDTLWRVTAGTETEEFGWSLAPLGDVNGDGIPDLAAGARQNAAFAPPWGRVRVIDGASGAIVASWGQGAGAVAGIGLGFTLVAIGDLDGDGRSELAGGQPGTEPFPPGWGHGASTRVWSAAPTAPLFEIPRPGLAGSGFGLSLASGDANGDGLRDLLIGEPFDDAVGFASGAVRLYTFVRAPVGYCEAQANSLGCTPTIASSGTPSASAAQSFDIDASGVLSNVSGLLFYGFTPIAAPYFGGTLCVRAPLRRTAVQSSGGNPPPQDCSGGLTFDFNGHIQTGTDPALAAGEEVFVQYWSRDASAQGGTNFTAALAFYVEP